MGKIYKEFVRNDIITSYCADVADYLMYYSMTPEQYKKRDLCYNYFSVDCLSDYRDDEHCEWALGSLRSLKKTLEKDDLR